jgi:hypothetical protein
MVVVDGKVVREGGSWLLWMKRGHEVAKRPGLTEKVKWRWLIS